MQVRLPDSITPVLNELAEAQGTALTGRSLAYIAGQLIEQSPAYIETKDKIDRQPPKKLKTKS